jgi:hypothetical protein
MIALILTPATLTPEESREHDYPVTPVKKFKKLIISTP